MFTDINLRALAHRAMPERVRPYILLARLDRPIGIWLLLLPGWWAIVMASGGARAMSAQEWTLFGLFGVGAVVMRSAGCVVNDIWDRKLDASVERTRHRPLASGTLDVPRALVFLFVLLALGLLILLQMNAMTIALGILSLPLIAAYPVMKRLTWWPQAFLGVTFNWGALMGWSAVAGVPEASAFLLYVAGIFWTLGYDTVYAHQDIEDDALAGIKSTARKFGSRSKIWVGGFYGTALCILFYCTWTTAGTLSALLLLPAAAHVVWQLKAWQLNNQASALRIFKSNRLFGLLVLLAFML